MKSYTPTVPRPILWYLQSVELFSGIEEEEMHEMLQGMLDRQYENKEFLYTEHERPSNVYILKDGEVTLYKSVDGKRVILDILKPGAVFGNIGFDPDSAEPHFAEVTQESYICTLPENYFLQIIQKRPDIALRAMKILSKRVAQYETQIKTLSTLQARDRILATIRLLDQKEQGSILPQVLRKPTKITHQKLADMTSLTRETVTKQLQKLQEEGLIEVNKKTIHLTETGMREVMGMH